MSRSQPLLARLLAGIVGLASGPACAALPDGISGTWYNPSQSGHGLSVSLHDRGSRAAVIWHVYDGSGEPLTLYVEGTVRGRAIVGTAYAPIGMRFGEFDPESLVLPAWGEVSLEFASCTQASLRWRSSDEEFGSGEMPVEPLSMIAALPCALPPPNSLAAGLYRGRYLQRGDYPEAWGVVDGEGRLWGGTLFRGSQVWQAPSPQPRAVVSLAEVAAEQGDALYARLRSGDAGLSLLRAGEGGGVGGESSFLGFDLSTLLLGQEWRQGAPSGVALVTPVSLHELAGQYDLPYVAPPLSFAAMGEITIDAQGEMCVRYQPQESSACHLEGRLSVAEGDRGLIDFALRRLSAARQTPWRGRGWLAEVDGIETLCLIGDDGEVGFYLIGRRR